MVVIRLFSPCGPHLFIQGASGSLGRQGGFVFFCIFFSSAVMKCPQVSGPLWRKGKQSSSVVGIGNPLVQIRILLSMLNSCPLLLSHSLSLPFFPFSYSIRGLHFLCDLPYLGKINLFLSDKTSSCQTDERTFDYAIDFGCFTVTQGMIQVENVRFSAEFLYSH